MLYELTDSCSRAIDARVASRASRDTNRPKLRPCPPPADGTDDSEPPAALPRLHRAPCLEQRFHVAENPGPSAGARIGELARHRAGHKRRALELVDQREPREAGRDLLDLPRDAR